MEQGTTPIPFSRFRLIKGTNWVHSLGALCLTSVIAWGTGRVNYRHELEDFTNAQYQQVIDITLREANDALKDYTAAGNIPFYDIRASNFKDEYYHLKKERRDPELFKFMDDGERVWNYQRLDTMIGRYHGALERNRTSQPREPSLPRLPSLDNFFKQFQKDLEKTLPLRPRHHLPRDKIYEV